MAVTINDVEYDEKDLEPGVANSIRQVQNANAQIAGLQAELLNAQIIAQHHGKFIQDNLPKVDGDEDATDSDEDTTEAADVGADE